MKKSKTSKYLGEKLIVRFSSGDVEGFVAAYDPKIGVTVKAVDIDAAMARGICLWKPKKYWEENGILCINLPIWYPPENGPKFMHAFRSAMMRKDRIFDTERWDKQILGGVDGKITVCAFKELK